ncbi:MAG: ATP F0F1 synthase subunit B, partial [Lachnospiraceae bacterium]|nr:ATP F0F1 synthase subunit B [Lachnospiraceae bacterium]
MEDVRWLLRRFGLPILLLLIFVIVGVICWGKIHEEEQKVAEEVWEPPIEMENSEAATEADADTSTESAYWFVPQASDCLITDEEKEQLQSMALSAADSVAEIYKDMVIADAPSYSSGIGEFTSEQRKAVVEQLGRSGLVSVEEDTAMQNHEAVETFYADYLDGRDSMVT